VKFPGRGPAEWLERFHYDAAAQVNRITWTFIFPNGTKEVQRLDMRCFFPQELELLMKAHGFNIVERFGDFNRDAFQANSPEQILLCRAMQVSTPRLR
jgi:hypothetical protein